MTGGTSQGKEPKSVLSACHSPGQVDTQVKYEKMSLFMPILKRANLRKQNNLGVPKILSIS